MFLVFKRIYAFNDFNTIIVDEGQGRLKVDIVAIICRMFAVRIKLLNPKNKGLHVYMTSKSINPSSEFFIVNTF